MRDGVQDEEEEELDMAPVSAEHEKCREKCMTNLALVALKTSRFGEATMWCTKVLCAKIASCCARTCVCAQYISACMCWCLCGHAGLHAYVNTYIQVRERTHTRAYAHAHACMHVCARMHAHVLT